MAKAKACDTRPDTLTVAPDLPVHQLKDTTLEKAQRMLTLRAQGMTWDEIAPLVGYKTALSARNTFHYVLKQHQLTKDQLVLPEDRLEFRVKPKVVDNIELLLDSEDLETKREVTLKAAKMLFGEAAGQAQPHQVTAIQVNVVMPEGGMKAIRVGTVGGTPAVLDVEGEDAN